MKIGTLYDHTEVLFEDIWGVLLLSIAIAAAWGIVHLFLHRFVFTPIAYALVGNFTKQSSPEIKKKLSKAPGYIGSFVYHGVQWVLWLQYSTTQKSWWLDYSNWYKTMAEPLVNDNGGFKQIAPLYAMYFGFLIFSIVNDHFKRGKVASGSRPNAFSESLMTLTFNIHHIVAFVLVAMSMYYGPYRPGFLTRIFHDPTDIILNPAFIYRLRYQLGNGTWFNTGIGYTAIAIAFFVSRVVLYGVVVYHCQLMLNSMYFGELPGDILIPTVIMVLGCWVMWLLQVVWFVGITNNTIDHWTGKSKRKNA